MMPEKIEQVNLDKVNKITDALLEFLRTNFGDSTHIEIIAAFHEVIGTKYVHALEQKGIIRFTQSEHLYGA